MPAETHQLASPGAIREAEEGWGKEPACSGCLTFSPLPSRTHLPAQVLQRAKLPHVRHPAGSREPSPHAHPITLQKLTVLPRVPDCLTWLPKVSLWSTSVLKAAPRAETPAASLPLFPASRAGAQKGVDPRHLGRNRAFAPTYLESQTSGARSGCLCWSGRGFSAPSPGTQVAGARGGRSSASRTPGDPLLSLLLSPLRLFLCSAAPVAGFLDWKAGNPILPGAGARPAGEGTEGKWRMGGLRGAGWQRTRLGRGARRALASWLGSFFWNARFSRGPSRPPPSAPARGFEPRDRGMKDLFRF